MVLWGMVRKVFFAIAGFLFTVLLISVLLVSSRPDDAEPIVRLETHRALSGTADSDGDGVPNWLEEITNSDALSSSSFPYNRDIVQAKKNTDEDLLYGGPGDFTEEIIQRFLFDIDGSASVTEEESDRFVRESADYFLQQVEERGMPEIDLRVDNTVSRQEVLNRFASVLQQFSEQEKPVDVLVFEIFAKKPAAVERARRVRGSCEHALRTFPRAVPQDVYDPYYIVLERVTYLCEALTIALTSNTTDNFFYALKLVQVGTLSGISPGDASAEGDSAQNRFLLATQEVVQLLER